jgi:NADH dehydrogenase
MCTPAGRTARVLPGSPSDPMNLPTPSADPRPHVVIIGGGFGGLACARALARADARVTLVDRRNHHLFQPLLYQVATAALSATDIAAPIRQLLRRQKNCTVLLDEVASIDRAERTVMLGRGTLRYDWLVVAAGATNRWFGEGWEEHAPGLKSLEDALTIRRRVLLAYEEAEQTHDPETRDALLTFCVVGAGPTGVEMAGALAEIARTTLARNFRTFDPAQARVLLVEASPAVLGAFPASLQASAAKQLTSIGVELRLGERVESLDAEGVTLSSGRVACRTIVWAAGVQAAPLLRSLDTKLDRMGRAHVTASLHLPDDPRVFVIGDAAHFLQGEEPLPGVAPVAMQQGRWVGGAIRRSVARQAPPAPFVYFDKGSMATIGRNRAVAVTGVGRRWPATTPAMRFTGWLAWLAWLFVHVLVLVDFRNRLSVLAEWAWYYVTWNRSARVILQ